MPKCQDRDESRVGGWGTNDGEHEVNGNGQNHHRDGPWDSNRGVVQPRFPPRPLSYAAMHCMLGTRSAAGHG